MEDPGLKNAELAALVHRARGGDESALGELVRATQSRLFRFLFLLGADSALANDLCQDSYLYTFEKLGELREPGAFLSWLFRIARSRFLDHARKPRESALPDDHPEQLAGEDLELVLHVRRTLAALDEADRALLILVDLEGHSYGEAAALLSISEAALTSRLRRAREAFHKGYFSE